MATMAHPIANLQVALGATNYLCSKPTLDIDDISTSVIKTLTEHYVNTFLNIDIQFEAIDTEMNHILLNSKICNLARQPRSREMTLLRSRHLYKLYEVLNAQDNSKDLFYAICKPNLIRHIMALEHRPDILIGNLDEYRNPTIYNIEKHISIKVSSLTSKQIRLTLQNSVLLTNTKMLNSTNEQASQLYKRVQKIASTQNKTKLLRLIHGDVYCGSRLMKFNLSNNDRCLRCFEEETIQHLLIECPYTMTIWRSLGLNPLTLLDLIGDTSIAKLEIIADIISEIVFRKKIMPPETMLRMIYTTYANGKCRREKVTTLAVTVLSLYNSTRQWH
jgi:hypothetical protein